MFKLLKLGN